MEGGREGRESEREKGGGGGGSTTGYLHVCKLCRTVYNCLTIAVKHGGKEGLLPPSLLPISLSTYLLLTVVPRQLRQQLWNTETRNRTAEDHRMAGLTDVRSCRQRQTDRHIKKIYLPKNNSKQLWTHFGLQWVSIRSPFRSEFSIS